MEKLIVVDISPISNGSAYALMTIILAAVEKVKLPSNSIPIASVKRYCNKQLASTIEDRDIRAFLLSNLEQGPLGK